MALNMNWSLLFFSFFYFSFLSHENMQTCSRSEMGKIFETVKTFGEWEKHFLYHSDFSLKLIIFDLASMSL